MAMTKLDDLIAAHPLLFRGAHPPVPSHLPAGWYALVDELCCGIESNLGRHRAQQFQVKQVKEKYGGLRFYFAFAGAEDRFFDFQSDEGLCTVVQHANGPPAMDAIRELVKLAAQASQVTCQKCGALGKRGGYGGRMATLCEVHQAERNEQEGQQS